MTYNFKNKLIGIAFLLPILTGHAAQTENVDIAKDSKLYIESFLLKEEASSKKESLKDSNTSKKSKRSVGHEQAFTNRDFSVEKREGGNRSQYAIYPELKAVIFSALSKQAIIYLNGRTYTFEDGAMTVCGKLYIINAKTIKLGSQTLELN